MWLRRRLDEKPRSERFLERPPRVLADCVGDLIVRDTAHVASTGLHKDCAAFDEFHCVIDKRAWRSHSSPQERVFRLNTRAKEKSIQRIYLELRARREGHDASNRFVPVGLRQLWKSQ